MAARLTDKQKKKIIADYLETESYNATAKKNGVCGPWFSTKDLNSYQDFENLKTTIRGMTRPLTLKSGDEQRRLDIRITDEAREQIRGCYLFREYGVTVK